MTMPPQAKPPIGDGSLYYGDDTPTPMRRDPTAIGKTGIAPAKLPPPGTLRPMPLPPPKPPVGVVPTPKPPMPPVMPPQNGLGGGGAFGGGDMGGMLTNWDVSPVTKALAMRHLSGGGYGSGGNTGGGF